MLGRKQRRSCRTGEAKSLCELLPAVAGGVTAEMDAVMHLLTIVAQHRPPNRPPTSWSIHLTAGTMARGETGNAEGISKTGRASTPAGQGRNGRLWEQPENTSARRCEVLADVFQEVVLC